MTQSNAEGTHRCKQAICQLRIMGYFSLRCGALHNALLLTHDGDIARDLDCFAVHHFHVLRGRFAPDTKVSRHNGQIHLMAPSPLQFFRESSRHFLLPREQKHSARYAIQTVNEEEGVQVELLADDHFDCVVAVGSARMHGNRRRLVDGEHVVRLSDHLDRVVGNRRLMFG